VTPNDPDSTTILVIEDDAPTRKFLADNLEADGYDVVSADCVRDGLRLLETHSPDLALVDVGLPDATGHDLMRMVRQADGIASRIDPDTPLVILSGRSDDVARVRGFERGADDFLAKPFCYPELRARIGAVLRRTNGRQSLGRMRVGALEVDPSTREVLLRGVCIPLPAKEFALLRTLASEPTRVFRKEELLRVVWGYRSIGVTRTLDTHACRLRRRLRVDGDRFVVTVWGVGYRLVDGPMGG
jgi:DNA-binding response OmpR family regulator